MYIDDIKTLVKASKSTLEISLFSEFHRYVREFNMYHKNKDIIKNAFTSNILLNVISVSFNPNSNYFKIIEIPRYLHYLKHKKLNMNNPFSINESNLYKEVMLIKYYDVFQSVIYQYDKNVKSAYEITNIMFRSRYPSENLPSLETVSDCWMNQFFMRKLLYNKYSMISIEHIYTEICKNCDFSVPTFDTIKKLY